MVRRGEGKSICEVEGKMEEFRLKHLYFILGCSPPPPPPSLSLKRSTSISLRTGSGLISTGIIFLSYILMDNF